MLKKIIFIFLLIISNILSIYSLELKGSTNPTIIEKGEDVSILWETIDATYCQGIKNINGELSLSGEIKLNNVLVDKEYIIECNDSLNNKVNKSFFVKTIPSFPIGNTLEVGENREYTTFNSAIQDAQDNDIIKIFSGTYICDITQFNINNLTIIGVGDSKPIFNSSGCNIDNGKGTWVSQGKNLIIENIGFVGTQVNDNNGAGIRVESEGVVQIKKSTFKRNQNGILFTPLSNLNQSYFIVDQSEFDLGGTGSGYQHNIYIGKNINTFIFKNSLSTRTNDGHLIKSRAQNNYILYNKLMDLETGSSSYNINIPDSGLTYIIGNVIEQGKNSPNSAIIDYGSESEKNKLSKLFISSNTILDNKNVSGVVAIQVKNRSSLNEIKIYNNLLVNLEEEQLLNFVDGDLKSKIISKGNNLFIEDNQLVDPINFNFHLKNNSEAIDFGISNIFGYSFSLIPQFEYIYDLDSKKKEIKNNLDVGAFEYYENSQIKSPTLTFKSNAYEVKENSTITLTWDSKNTKSCEGSGDWSGSKSLEGNELIKNIKKTLELELICIGDNSDYISKKISIILNNDAPFIKEPENEKEIKRNTTEIEIDENKIEISENDIKIKYEIFNNTQFEKIVIVINEEEYRSLTIDELNSTNLFLRGLKDGYINLSFIIYDSLDDILYESDIFELYISPKYPTPEYLNCIPKYSYFDWRECKNNYQFRDVVDLNGCYENSVEKRKCIIEENKEKILIEESIEEEIKLNALNVSKLNETTFKINLKSIDFNDKFYINSSQNKIYILNEFNNETYLGTKMNQEDVIYYSFKKIIQTNENLEETPENISIYNKLNFKIILPIILILIGIITLLIIKK